MSYIANMESRVCVPSLLDAILPESSYSKINAEDYCYKNVKISKMTHTEFHVMDGAPLKV